MAKIQYLRLFTLIFTIVCWWLCLNNCVANGSLSVKLP